jgi:phosphoglycolate phosphatase-like HAD superfamily hydrolase
MTLTVLLDVDGTLVDSNDAHAHSWCETLARFGHDVSYARVRSLIGMGGDKLVETLTCIAPDDERSKQLRDARSDNFRDKWLATVRPLRGSRDLVLRLRGEAYQYAIASAAQTEELEPLLEIADIGDLVEIRTSSSDVAESKPAPDIIEATLAKLLLVERSRTVMVGDTPYDARAAREAGVAFIGVTTGGWAAEALAGARRVYDGPAALARASWDLV